MEKFPTTKSPNETFSQRDFFPMGLFPNERFPKSNISQIQNSRQPFFPLLIFPTRSTYSTQPQGNTPNRTNDMGLVTRTLLNKLFEAPRVVRTGHTNQLIPTCNK